MRKYPYFYHLISFLCLSLFLFGQNEDENINAQETPKVSEEPEQEDSSQENTGGQVSEAPAGINPIGRHFLLALALEDSPDHDYTGFRLTGSQPLKEHTSFNFNLELGSYDYIDEVDSFLRFKAGVDLTFHKELASDGLLSRITPFAKFGIEYDYFSNKETYTTGYDFSPLAYSDYYWEYYVETGYSFDFWNHTLSGGVQLELVENKLYAVYNLLKLDSFTEDALGSKTTNKYEIFYMKDSGTMLYLSVQDEDLYSADNKMWTLGIGFGF